MYEPAQIFKAAVALSHAVYGPELFWHQGMDCDPYDGLGHVLAWRAERDRDCVPYKPRAHPVSLAVPGATWSSGGLALHLVHGRPAWIETPWGEWPCFAYSSADDKHANGETTQRLIRTLDIDADRSHCGCKIFAIRTVRGIRLPPYEVTHGEPPRSLLEWAGFCRSHIPPLVVSERLEYLEQLDDYAVA